MFIVHKKIFKLLDILFTTYNIWNYSELSIFDLA